MKKLIVEVIGKGTTSADSPKKKKTPEELAEQQNARLKTMAKASVTALTVQTVKAVIRYELSGIQYETGDSNYQAQVNEKYNDIMTWVNTGTGSLMAGIGGFAAAGPLGALIGAGTALVSSGIRIISQIKQEERKLNYSIWEDNVKVDYNKARANINLYGGGRLR